MKKITLLLILATSFTYAQNLTWDNPVAAIEVDSNLSLEISWDVAPAADTHYIAVFIRRFNSGGALVSDTTWTYMNVGNTGNTSDGGNPSGTSVAHTLPIASDLPLSSEIGTDYYRLGFYIRYNNSTQDGALYTDLNVVASGTLGVSKYEKLTSFYPNPVKDIVYFGNDVQTENYKVLSVTGALIREEKATKNSMDLSNLKPGLYFLATDKSVAKIVKK